LQKNIEDFLIYFSILTIMVLTGFWARVIRLITVKVLQNFGSSKLVPKIETNLVAQKRKTKTTDKKFLSHCLNVRLLMVFKPQHRDGKGYF